MIECAEYVKKRSIVCRNKNCKYTIDCSNDLNCAIVSADQNGSQNLREIAEKMNLSYVRIFQIEKDAMRKISEKNDAFRELLNE